MQQGIQGFNTRCTPAGILDCRMNMKAVTRTQMFSRIDECARAGELSTGCLHLLRVLAWHTTYSTGRVRAAMCNEEELAKLTGVTPRTIVTSLQKLAASGWIRTEYGSTIGVPFRGNNKLITLLPAVRSDSK